VAHLATDKAKRLSPHLPGAGGGWIKPSTWALPNHALHSHVLQHSKNGGGVKFQLAG
jgi:hypothetical protein